MVVLVVVGCDNNVQSMSQQYRQEQPKLTKYLHSHPIGQQQAQKLHLRRLRTSCVHFLPHKQYYLHYPISYVQPPRPCYLPTSKYRFQEKVRLSEGRQMEYLRGTMERGRGIVEEDWMEGVLEEDRGDRGLVGNFKNRSLLLMNGVFVYASGEKIVGVRIVENGEIEQQQREYNAQLMKGFQFGQPIHQLATHTNNQIIVRCRYWIYRYNPFSCTIIAQQRLKEQITCIKSSSYSDFQSIMICTYDQHSYRVYEWTPLNILTCVRVCQSFYPIHSMIGINMREYIFGQGNQIFVEDIRCGNNNNGSANRSRETLKRISQVGDDRFCVIGEVQGMRNYVVLGRSHYVDIFDIRRSVPSVRSIRHFCEEAPPSCLLSFNWGKPMLVAYSPYQMGSSLLMDMNFGTSGHKGKQQVILLYDSGKYFKGLHPISISLEVESQYLKLFHLDSCDGISYEVLKKQAQNGIVHVVEQNVCDYPQNPVKKWLQLKQIQPYFSIKKQQYYQSGHSSSDEEQESMEESHIFLKNNNYCSLDKFRLKLLELSKMPNQRPNQKSSLENDTYQSSFQPSEPAQKFMEIMKNKIVNYDTEGKIGQELLDFIEKEWKI